MATDQRLQDVAHHDDALRDHGLWAKREVLRIEALSKQQVLRELQGIMEGRNYSWNYISELLQARFDEGSLEFSLKDGTILREWNNLCAEKRAWEKKGHLSTNDAEFNMDCLINLKILPVQAGLGIEGPRLVTSNMDTPDISTIDLWVGPKDQDSLERYVAKWRLADDTTSSSESEDSEYIDEYDGEEVDDEDVNEDESDEERAEDEDVGGLGVHVVDEDVGEEESEYSDDDSEESGEVETEDDIEGLSVKIVGVDFDDDDELSDFEL